jgi:hypothetical protein
MDVVDQHNVSGFWHVLLEEAGKLKQKQQHGHLKSHFSLNNWLVSLAGPKFVGLNSNVVGGGLRAVHPLVDFIH